MSDLIVRGDVLHSHASKARAVAADLSAAHSQAEEAAAAVGHHDLARAVLDFGSQWDIHRHRFMDEVRTLADIFDAINSTMADIDGNLASQMSETAPPAREAMPARTAQVRGA